MSTTLILPDGQEDTEERNQVVIDHLPLVRRVARRLWGKASSQVVIDDMVQEGVLGLMDAYRRFDPTQGVKFATFAETRVRGAMVDALRKDSWPRTIRKIRRNIEDAKVRLQYSGIESSTENIAQSLGLPEDQFRREQLRITVMEAIAGFADADARALPQTLLPQVPIDPDAAYVGTERATWLRAAIKTLRPRQRKVAFLYYFKGFTMQEVGRAIGVNESRVSQIHAETINQLQRILRPLFGGSMSRGTEPPKVWRPKVKKPNTPKALVVEADYYALTSRVDSNVVFWSVGYAHEHSMIPPDITHLWVSPRTRREVRMNLCVQALKRDIVVWKCNILQLRENLLPIWAEERNRSMVYPAIDQGPDEFAEREEKEKVFRSREKQERLLALREAGARAAEAKAKVEAEREARIQAALTQFPRLDRKVYESYLRHADKNGGQIAAVVEEFRFPRVNIERIVRRVESVITEG